jgi:hypothetical protein
MDSRNLSTSGRSQSTWPENGVAEQRRPDPDTVVVHPNTAEVLDHLDQQPPEVLAECLHAVTARQATLKASADALDAELRRRLQIRGRNVATFGDWTVALEQGREAVWEGEQAEEILRELVDEGVLRAGELTDVISHETVIHRSAMNRVLARLTDTYRGKLEAARYWQSRGRGRLRVTATAQLIEEGEDGSS